MDPNRDVREFLPSFADRDVHFPIFGGYAVAAGRSRWTNVYRYERKG